MMSETKWNKVIFSKKGNIFWTMCPSTKSFRKKYPFWKEVSRVKLWHNQDGFCVKLKCFRRERWLQDLEIGSHWIQDGIKKYLKGKKYFYDIFLYFLQNKLWEKKIQNKIMEK